MARKTKAKARSKTKSQSSKMMGVSQLVMMYFLFFIANSLVILMANTLFPKLVVLGTHLISPLGALFQSMLVFSLVVVSFTPIVELVANQYKLKMSDKHWLVLYFLINAGVLWLIARFAEMLGLGIASWMIVAMLALVMDLAQGVVTKLFIQSK